MKRRSPWLAVAACVLMRGGAAHAEPVQKPVVQISKAPAIAEARLKKREYSESDIASAELGILDGDNY